MGDTNGDFHERLEQAKLDAMKELAYGASHEINNPLANISARAQTLLRDERDPERRRALEAINQQALRAHEMISDLMLFARPPRLELNSVDVGAVVRQVADELAGECRFREIQLSVAVAAALPEVVADPMQLAVAMKAVLTNGVEAMGREGRIEVSVATFDVASLDAASPGERGSPAGWVRIVVTDSGPGIPVEIRPHIFEPFFSGREAGRGLGFGLSKAWRIITAHAGQITAESPDSGGAAFTITLPLSPPR